MEVRHSHCQHEQDPILATRRVRETNPYLLLDEEGGGADEYGSPEVRTELGLLTSSSERPYEEAGGMG